MGTLKGSFNRKTGKTTPRTKGRTHWGGNVKRSATSTKSTKSAKPAAAKK